MIKVSVEKYCENCPEFEPDVYKSTIANLACRPMHTETIIRCEHRERCHRMYQCLKEENAYD